MDTTEKKLLLKLFIGIQINSEIRMHLVQSIGWKEAKILKEFDPEHLVEVHFQDHDYIGRFLPQLTVKISELKRYETEVRDRLRRYCPKLKLEKFKLHILSQQFIT